MKLLVVVSVILMVANELYHYKSVYTWTAQQRKFLLCYGKMHASLEMAYKKCLSIVFYYFSEAKVPLLEFKPRSKYYMERREYGGSTLGFIHRGCVPEVLESTVVLSM